MPNYTNSKIYKLTSSSGLIYIGSTVRQLNIRLSGHKADYKRYKNNEIKYCITSFKLFEEDYENIKIELIENFKCNNKKELYERERYYINLYDCVNKVKRPSITNEELKERVKKYYETNKEHIIENKKIYEKKHKNKIKEYQQNYKIEKSKELKEYYKKWREENKEKMRLYMINYRKNIKNMY
jgi:hypothetical protein